MTRVRLKGGEFDNIRFYKKEGFNSDGVRVDFALPSVTSILNHQYGLKPFYFNKAGWKYSLSRKYEGDETLINIEMNCASQRGTIVHQYLEDYILEGKYAKLVVNGKVDETLFQQITSPLKVLYFPVTNSLTPRGFLNLADCLFQVRSMLINLNNWLLTNPHNWLYSEKFTQSLALGFAGTVDAVYENPDGSYGILDLKTTKAPKNYRDFFHSEDLISKFTQTYAYGELLKVVDKIDITSYQIVSVSPSTVESPKIIGSQIKSDKFVEKTGLETYGEVLSYQIAQFKDNKNGNKNTGSD